jgi:hypothetical protein
VRNHGLARLKTELVCIEPYRNDIGLERHPVRNAADLSIGFRI